MEEIGGNALIIKEINMNLVRKALKEKGLATKQQISKITGLSLVTVGTVLQHLASNQEVFQSELCPSSGGRPAQQYGYNYDFSHGLILFPYEAKNHIIVRSAIVNLAGQCIHETDTEVETIDLKVFEGIIGSLLEAYPSIKAMGFGHPGVEEGGKIIMSDYNTLIGTSFAAHFSTLYQVPAILENDVNAAVTGFAMRKKLPHDSTLVYLYFPDKHSPGAGIFINGRLFKGSRNFAGEVASIPSEVIWDEALYSSFDMFCQAATRLIITICSILNPDRIVLNGNFLDSKHIETIAGNCNTRLPQNMAPLIQLSDNFLSDYQSGLIAQTLEQLEPGIKLTGKKQLEV